MTAREIDPRTLREREGYLLRAQCASVGQGRVRLGGPGGGAVGRFSGDGYIHVDHPFELRRPRWEDVRKEA